MSDETRHPFLVVFVIGKHGKEQSWVRYGTDAHQVELSARRAIAEEWPDKTLREIWVSRIIDASPEVVAAVFSALDQGTKQ
jgi:hypothetical protein